MPKKNTIGKEKILPSPEGDNRDNLKEVIPEDSLEERDWQEANAELSGDLHDLNNILPIIQEGLLNLLEAGKQSDVVKRDVSETDKDLSGLTVVLRQIFDEIKKERSMPRHKRKVLNSFLVSVLPELRVKVKAISDDIDSIGRDLTKYVNQGDELEIGDIQKALKIVSVIIDEMHSEALDDEHEPTKLLLSSWLDEHKQLFARFVDEEVIDFTLENNASSAVVAISSHRLFQSIKNLLINARQAIPRDRKGAVRLSVESTKADGQPVVIIMVEDNGIGIDPKVRDHIFDDFFTTKGKGSQKEGNGLGLSNVKRFIEKAGGRIEVESRPGSGSVFKIILPEAKIG